MLKRTLMCLVLAVVCSAAFAEQANLDGNWITTDELITITATVDHVWLMSEELGIPYTQYPCKDVDGALVGDELSLWKDEGGFHLCFQGGEYDLKPAEPGVDVPYIVFFGEYHGEREP